VDEEPRPDAGSDEDLVERKMLDQFVRAAAPEAAAATTAVGALVAVVTSGLVSEGFGLAATALAGVLAGAAVRRIASAKESGTRDHPAWGMADRAWASAKQSQRGPE
jgi:hypothetical protein